MNILNIGNRIIELRKQKGWSQTDLAKAIEASRDMIGKYERNDNLPSIEVAFKLADVFDISVDFLLGKGKHSTYDKETIKRLEDIESLDQQTRATLFNVIDTFLRDSKARLAYK
ncbi:transcriptional regulator [Flavivirga aquatica]|uniref:Transcriptional regulator n=1 Tax=Flavivirga aquatica TaxID=1849968 RepID=A0A1E5TA08_9FLAO|nr:helix-turn-helix transcriptional regulator [Flavivirga aquatica]OEK08204.1 transcriptional regulator [Flavivirga aquatica]